MYQWDEHIDFNRYTNLDGVEGRILEGLIKSKTVHAMRLWNILSNDTINCLNQPNVALLSNPDDEEGWNAEFQRRRNMVYFGTGESSEKKVFLSPYVDDAWTAESSRLDIFVDDIASKNHLVSTVMVGVEVLVHNKIVNINSDADEDNDNTNPAEMIATLNDEGEEVQEPLIRVKSRPTVMLKSALAELNGVFVAGVGQLQVNSTMNKKCGVTRQMWNNRAYIGYSIVFATLMSGVSDNPIYGF